jgi:hypothetical protein
LSDWILYIIRVSCKHPILSVQQGCQMVYLQTKNPNLVYLLWNALEFKIFVYFTTIWYILYLSGMAILRPFGIFCGNSVYFWMSYHLATLFRGKRKSFFLITTSYFVVIWYISPYFGMLYKNLATLFRRKRKSFF